VKDLVIGDLHIDSRVGNKESFFFINKVKDKIIKLSQECDRTIILGDLFKNAHPDNPARKELSDFLAQLKCVYIIIGNHDVDINGHVLLDLQPIVKNLVIVDDYLETDNCVMIAYNRDEQHIADNLAKSKKKLVYGHFGLGEYEYNNHPFKSNLGSGASSKQYILGHIHKRQVIGNIIYPGSVAPTNLSELEQESGVMILNDDGSHKFIDFDYGIKKIVVKGIEWLDEIDTMKIDELTFLEIHLKELKEKHLYMAAIKEHLAINFTIETVVGKKKKMDLNIDFNTIVEEYLKMIGKTKLKDRIFKYLEDLK